MMERINYLTKNPEIIDREKTRYRFEPLSQYAHVISQIHFFITESSHKLDPKTELKEFIQETKQKNPEIFTRMFEVGSIFNLEHTSIVHLMIQLLTSYVFENRSIERIQFCQNHYQPKLNCNNLMIEKKQGAKNFCSGYCQKNYNARIRQSTGEQHKVACRKRQNSILKQRTKLISRHLLTCLPQPTNMWKEDCKDCTDYLKGLKGGECKVAQDRNQSLFKKYRKYKRT